MNGQELWGNSPSAKRSHRSPFLPTCLPLTPSQVPCPGTPQSRFRLATDLAALLGLSSTPAAEQDMSLSPCTSNHSMASHCKAGVLLWQTLNSCLLQKKGSCVRVNRFNPKSSSPSPVAHLCYNVRMSHRNAFFTLLCTSPWSSAVSPGATRVSLWQLQHCRTSLSTNGLVLSFHINNSSPGAISPMTTEETAVKFVNKTTEIEEFHG